MSKKIKLIVFVFAIFGLFSQLVALTNLNTSDFFNTIITIRNFTGSVNLTFFNSSLFDYYDSGIGINLINTTFYCLLLVGAILFVITKEKEIRLIRFGMSVIFISSAFFLMWNILTPIFYFDQLSANTNWFIFLLLSIIKNACCLYASYYVLSAFNQSNTIPVAENPLNAVKYKTASRWQRWGHLVIDVYICLFIFSPYSFTLESFLNTIASHTSERFAMYVVYVISSLIYYVFFESVLGATPAKFLTQTKVIDENGEKPTFTKVLIRTFYRYIPFESLSFFGNNGWHDSISETKVVCEDRSGVKGSLYLLIIPVFILIGLGIYFGHKQYKHFIYNQYLESVYDEKINSIKKALKNPTTSTIIEIKDIADPYASNRLFLKVEEINPDEITAVLIILKNNYSNSLLTVERFYDQNLEQLPNITIKRSDLDRAYTSDFSKSRDEGRTGVDLLKDGKRFEIVSIDNLFCPSIHDLNTGSYGSTLSLNFCNYGWPAKIISIETIEGNIIWEDKEPIDAPTVGSGDYPSFQIYGTGYKSGEKYKFKMTVIDSLQHKQTYEVEGYNMNKTVHRLN